MVLFNYATRELTAKVVYYGAGLCGKTTNLEYIHKSLPEKTRGKMLSLATQTDRTLFFDFLPIDLGSVKGMKTRVQLYTVPGQVFYDATRKLVLKGADGVVFVVDSQKEMLDSNLDSWHNLTQNLKENNLDINSIPLVIQYNKRDLPNVLSVKELNKKMNGLNAPFFEAIAINGFGVQETLKGIAAIVLQTLSKRYAPKEEKEIEEAVRIEVPVEETPVAIAEEEPIDLSALEEEIRELPNAEELETVEEAPLNLEPVSESIEDSPSIGELEEVHELQEELPAEPPVAASIAEAAPQPEAVSLSERQPEVHRIESPRQQYVTTPLRPEEPRVSASATVAVDVSRPKRSTSSLDQELEKIVPKEITRRKTSKILEDQASSKSVNIPLEVSVDRNGQEIKLQISINLKINLG